MTMTSLERSALLGDKQAQKECTSRGIVLACPFCGGSDGKTLFKFVHSDLYAHKRTGRCALDGMIIHNVADWNRRPAPPIGRCGECKHSTNPAALTMIYGEPETLTCHHGPCNRRNVNKNDFCSYFEPKEEK